MRKRTTGILFMLAVLLNLWGICTLMNISSFISWYDFNSMPLLFFPALPVSSIRIIMITEAVIALLAAVVLSMIAWIAVLSQHAKTQRWGLFTLTFFFGGIMLIIYLFTDSQPDGGRPALSLQANFPQAPPAVPATQRRRQLFRFGLIGGGIVAAINIFWTIVVVVLTYASPQFFYGANSYGPGSYAIGLPGMSLVIFGEGIPLLLTLAVFFWVGKMAMQHVGHVSAGVDTALRVFLWLLLASLLLFISDIVVFLIQNHRYVYELMDFAWQDLKDTIFVLLLAFALGLPLAAWGARTGTPGPVVLQAGPFASPQPLNVGAYPLASQGASYSSSPSPNGAPAVPPPFQAAQPPQPLSAQEILRQRFARGEIDAATYQQMHAQLEAPARPDSRQ